jgi:YfiH family protein
MMSLALRSALFERSGFSHGFFLRRGGVSPPPWESLNFSTGTGDDPARVAENLLRAARELGLEPDRIRYLSQVHGTEVKVLTGHETREQVLAERGDITASRVPGVGCAVRMADCPAVLLADPEGGAVAAVHSGWRGTVRGACAAGVRALEELGARRVIAAIGPHIEQCCFEVGEDVAAEIAAASLAGDSVVVRGAGPRPHVDLRRVLEAQLTTLGVDTIDHVRGCTMCDRERFHSYRRDGEKSGRMMAAIAARLA